MNPKIKYNPTQLNFSDFNAPATVTTIVGQYVRIGALVVKAGQLMTIGIGSKGGFGEAIGRYYQKMINATTGELVGTIRLSYQDANDQPIKILGEWSTAQLNTSATDRRQQFPLPRLDEFISRDKKLVMEFNCTTADTFTTANSTLQLDATRAYHQ